MGSHSVLIFSLLLISSIVFVSGFNASFADEIIATSTGFEDSTILEIKNNRGNTASIDMVRIWLSGENEFKSFKTENGWMGKNTPQGVIVFTSQTEIDPGQSVKFGIKTIENNPVINWKALDSKGEIISSASTTVTKSEVSENKPELNEPKIVTIKENSNFRFIPEKPASNSYFRVVGEDFVPNQSLDFYIANELKESVKVDSDGNNLISPDLELGVVSIEIDDGKSKALRNIEVISAKLINISGTETSIEAGESITFEGTAIPNQEMSVIIEDAINTEIFSRTVSVGESGLVNFNVEIPRGSVEGTYILSAFQGNESGITTFGVGQEPEPILIVRPTKLNFASDEIVNVEIQGPVNSQIAIILIDSADREKFSDTLNLGPDGKEMYKIQSSDLPTGAFTLNAKRGESSGSAVFTIGLTTGSGAISIQTTRDDYQQGDQILILGSTGSINVLLDITISDPDGKTIKKIETFSDRFGVFKVDNFRIPLDATLGKWNVNAKSGGNFKDVEFTVSGENKELELLLDKSDYNTNELMNISGSGARFSATVTLKIFDSEGIKIDELNITAKSNGEYLTMWQIPADLESGEYEMTVDDGASNTSTKFTIS